jgi:hypothetical protein
MFVLTWQSGAATDACTRTDHDGDGLAGCADPDCWPTCAPACPPGVACEGATCGDGTCDAPREGCDSCAADCGACESFCGDGASDPGEDCPGDFCIANDC